jgi:hypothetical protein
MNALRCGGWLLSCWIVVGLTNCVAQEEATNKAQPKLPAHPAMWINSPPITNEMLAGKAAVLFFFDAQDRGVADGWPRQLLISAKFDGTPVMFIGVCSGLARPQLEAYVRRVKLPWPVICDSDRSFVSQFGIQITPQAPRSVQVLQANGSFKPGDINNLEASAVEAMRDAKWKIDPKEIPAVLHSAWLAIEFGKYPEAASALKIHLKGKPEVKEAANRLNQIVLDDLASQVEAAGKAFDDEKKWDAFKRYSAIPARFKGFALPPEVATRIKELSDDDAIKEEQLAMKVLETTLQNAARSPTAQKGAARLLQKLIDDHPNTEAAAEAQKLLGQIGQ